jgi:hypothetical protein
MRIVLQHSKTGLYLKSLGRWTPNPTEALAFLDTVRAHDYSIYHRLSDTVIIPVAETSRYSAEKSTALAAVQT